VKRGRKKKTIYIDIVENIKFIYTSFDEFFLPVSQRVEMNYIFSDNVRILYLSCYFKCPKETVKLSKKSRNKRCSYRLFFLSCTCTIRVVTLYWPDIFCYTFVFGFWAKCSFLVPDSCWTTVRNSNSIYAYKLINL
jgi:hypothetical protein